MLAILGSPVSVPSSIKTTLPDRGTPVCRSSQPIPGQEQAEALPTPGHSSQKSLVRILINILCICLNNTPIMCIMCNILSRTRDLTTHELKDSATKTISLHFAGCLLVAVLCAPPVSADMIAQVEADWLKQQSQSGQAIEKSIEKVLRRGRALVRDLHLLESDCTQCLSVLDDVEQRLKQEKQKIDVQGNAHELPEAKGYHLVAVDRYH